MIDKLIGNKRFGKWLAWAGFLEMVLVFIITCPSCPHMVTNPNAFYIFAIGGTALMFGGLIYGFGLLGELSGNIPKKEG